MTPILYVGDVKQNDYEQYIQERSIYKKELCMEKLFLRIVQSILFHKIIVMFRR